MASTTLLTSTPQQQFETSCSSYVQQAQQAMHANQKARNSLLWSAVNAVGFSVVLYDLMESCQERSYIFDYLEFFFLCFFFLNIIYHAITYLCVFCTFKPVPLTERQKKLLGVKLKDPKFPTLTPPAKDKKEIVETSTPSNVTAMNLLNSSLLSSPSSTSAGSPQLSFIGSPSMLNTSASMQTANMSMSPSWINQSFTASWQESPRSSPQSPNLSLSSSWVYQPGSPAPGSQTNGLPDNEVPVIDEASLRQYLDQCDAFDKKYTTESQNLKASPGNLSFLWNNSTSASLNSEQVSASSAAYHLAPFCLPQDTNSRGSTVFESGATNAICVNETVWRKEGVSVECLSHWNKNLRQWLTVTVLERVSKEIDSVNVALQRICASDDRVGTTGLERLKKIATMPQVSQHVPNLSTLLPFLEITTHQEYLVTRIKDLVQGGCMSNYHWNSGGNYNGKPWEDYLPTDSAIILHMFASYLDLQLPPLLHRPDKRPFSSQFLLKPTDKPKADKDTIFIHQARLNPPHYVLYWRMEALEVVQGCNNLLHTLLLFLHRLRTMEGGMLGRMNLGLSGLNILWVIER